MAESLSYLIIASLVFGLLLILPSIMGLFGGNKFNVLGKTVLLTGASEGMGKSVAKQLASKGANVIIVARNIAMLKDALEEVQAAAANPSSQRFLYISADLCEQGGSQRIVDEATAWNNGRAPDIVWCILGASYPYLFLDTPTAKMRQQMDINFWTCVEMAQAILKDWLAPSSPSKGQERHLIFTSSVAAFYPVAGYSTYAPSKAAIKSLSDSLAQEVLLYDESVKIHTVFPGGISSPGMERENVTKPEITHILEESDPIQAPDMVAKRSIAGLERGEYLVTVALLGAAMRGCAWGGSKRNNWVLDTLMTWITSIVWLFVGADLDGKVKAYGKKHGHPSTYVKKPSD